MRPLFSLIDYIPMAITFSSILKVAGDVASHPIAQGGAITSLFIAGLEVAGYAGVAVPAWGIPLATLAGYTLYHLLPPKAQKEVDAAAQEAVAVVSKLPEATPLAAPTASEGNARGSSL